MQSTSTLDNDRWIVVLRSHSNVYMILQKRWIDGRNAIWFNMWLMKNEIALHSIYFIRKSLFKSAKLVVLPGCALNVLWMRSTSGLLKCSNCHNAVTFEHHDQCNVYICLFVSNFWFLHKCHHIFVSLLCVKQNFIDTDICKSALFFTSNKL